MLEPAGEHSKRAGRGGGGRRGGGAGEEGGEGKGRKGREEQRGGECGSHQSQQAAPEQSGRGSVPRVQQQPHPAGGQLGVSGAGGTRTSGLQPRLPLPAPPAERRAGTLGGRSAPGATPRNSPFNCVNPLFPSGSL